MKSLYLKISLAFTLVLLVIAFSYMLITTHAAKNYFLHTTQKLNASVANYLVEEVSPFKNGKVNEEALGTIMHSMMAVNPGIEVFLLDSSGEILSYVVLDSKIKLKRVNLAPVEQFIATSGEEFIVGDDPRSTDYKTIFSATEIYEGDQLLGYVYITLASEKYEAIASSLLGSYWLKLTFNSFIIALVMASLIGLVLTILLTRNLRKIVKTVNQFKEGNLKARIPEMKTNSELAILSSTFNQMADSILYNMESLKNIDNLRRELIANVSHDLRSPLAIINGYVETLMLKGDRITEEERDNYLKIINSSTDKITKLVADLFELSKLESGQMQLKLEPLKIQELLYDSCLKYELLAKTKNVSLQTEISESLPTVKADLYLIDRVIQNLIDNAVKYAPENGSVTMRAYYCNTSHRICISVKNTGEGIPEKDLPAIFDRYYMVDKGKNKIEGAGLGLAIVKKILEIHESEIRILSDSKTYTEFVFELDPELHFN